MLASAHVTFRYCFCIDNVKVAVLIDCNIEIIVLSTSGIFNVEKNTSSTFIWFQSQQLPLLWNFTK